MEKSNIWLIDKEKMLVCVHLLYEHYYIIPKPIECMYGDTIIQRYSILYYDESCLYDEEEDIMRVEKACTSLDECLEYLHGVFSEVEEEMWEVDYIDKGIAPYLRNTWLENK